MASCTEPLTPKQAKCLAAIEHYIAEHGYPPSYREICKAMGWTSVNCASDFVMQLERKGKIVRPPNKRSRALRVVGRGLDPIDLEQLRRERDSERQRADLWERRARALGWQDGVAQADAGDNLH
jgi:repressor LexA